MTRRGAVRKPRATTDLRPRRYPRRKARKFRTWTFPAGGVFARLMRDRRAHSQVLVRGGFRRASMPDWYMTRAGAASNPRVRADLRARRYCKRKARKFRTSTFSASALFAREMREGRRGNCYLEVAKHASCARAVFPETDISRSGCVPGPAADRRAGTRRKRVRCARAYGLSDDGRGPGCLPGGWRKTGMTQKNTPPCRFSYGRGQSRLTGPARGGFLPSLSEFGPLLFLEG